MDHAAEPRHGPADPRQQGRHRGLVGDVEARDLDRDPVGPQGRHGFAGLLGRGTGPPGQHEVAGAAVGEPARGGEPEPAQAAGDQVRAVGRRREDRRPAPVTRRQGRRRDDDLADVPRPLHDPERIHDLGGLERAVGQRRQRAVSEQAHDVGEQVLADRLALDDQLVEVDPEIGQVAPERLEADVGVGHVVALAEFDEAAERLQHRDAALHGLARQAVQHHVDPCPRHAADVLDELGGPRIEDVLGAQDAEQVAPLGRPRGGDDPGSPPAGDLDGREADAARAPVDQHPLLFREPRAADQGVIGREERDRHGRGGGGRERVGDGSRHRGRHRDVGRERRLGEGEHAIPDPEPLDARPDPHDAARAFEPEGRTRVAVLENLLGQDRQPPHHVAEVQARGLHRDLDLARARGPALFDLPGEPVEARALALDEPHDPLVGRHRGRVGQGDGLEAHDPGARRVQDDLPFGRPGQDRVAQAPRRHVGRQVRGEVDQPQVDRVVLVGERAREGPHGRLGRVPPVAVHPGRARTKDPERRLAGADQGRQGLDAQAALGDPVRAARRGRALGEVDERFGHLHRGGLEQARLVQARDLEARELEHGGQRRRGLAERAVVADHQGLALQRPRVARRASLPGAQQGEIRAHCGPHRGTAQVHAVEHAGPARFRRHRAAVLDGAVGRESRLQAEHEVAEHRGFGFEGDQHRIRRHGVGELAPGRRVVGQAMQAVGGQHEVDGTGRHVVETARERHPPALAQGQACPLEPAPVRFEQCEIRGPGRGEPRHQGRQGAVPDLQDAQGTVPGPGVAQAVEHARQRPGRRDSGGRSEIIGLDRGLGDRGLVLDRSGRDRVHQGLGPGREQQFGGTVRVLGGQHVEDVARVRQVVVGHQFQAGPALAHQPAAFQTGQQPVAPGDQALRHPALGHQLVERHDAVPGQGLEQAERHRGGPAFEQHVVGRRLALAEEVGGLRGLHNLQGRDRRLDRHGQRLGG